MFHGFVQETDFTSMAELYNQLTDSLSDENPTKLTEDILMNVHNINALDSHGYSLLHVITENRNTLLLQFVAEKRKDLDLDVAFGNNDHFLIYEILETRRTSTPLIQAITGRDTETAKLLINLGADVNKSDVFQLTPLYFAAEENYFNLFTTLIDHGAVNIKNHEQNMCVFELVLFRQYKQYIYKLLKAGLIVNYQKVPDGRPAFFNAGIQNIEITCMLLYYDVDPKTYNYFNGYYNFRFLEPEMVKLLELLCFGYGCTYQLNILALIQTIVNSPYDRYNHRVINILERISEIMDVTLVSDPYYTRLYDSCKNFNETDRLRWIWLSLSFGIQCPYINESLKDFGHGKELLALIWGSNRCRIRNAIDRSTDFVSSFNRLFPMYWKFLHENVDSIRGNQLLRSINTSATAESRLRMLSFFTNGFDRYEGPHNMPTFKIKTLAELSRNAARVFIMKRFETNTFYDVHEVINNLDIPKKMKKFLQLRIPVNCMKCRVTWCDCDLDDIVRSLARLHMVKI